MNTAISHGIAQNEKRICTGGMEYMRYFSLHNGDHKLVGIGTGIGDKVTHNGKTWVSDIDNNVWEPGLHGWTELGTTK